MILPDAIEVSVMCYQCACGRRWEHVRDPGTSIEMEAAVKCPDRELPGHPNNGVSGIEKRVRIPIEYSFERKP